MTNCKQRGVYTKIKRVFKTTASVFMMIMIGSIMVNGLTLESAHASTKDEESVWAIVVGDKELVYVESEKKGGQVIKGIEQYYRTKNSTLLDVELTPTVTVKEVQDVPSGIKVKSVEKAVDYICRGEKVYKKYVTQKGESLKSIAKKKGISAKTLVKLNENKYTQKQKLKKGTVIEIYAYNPYVDVITIEEVKKNVKVNYKTVYKNTKSLKYGTSKVKTKGKKGEKIVVRHILKINGKQQSSEFVSSKRIKKATSRIILKGTANVTAKKNKTFTFKTGADVVKYAKKFVGNPYKYGGTSLTKGADCSGFVYRVYKNMGVDLPRIDQDQVGKKISVKNMKKGDILFYSNDHVAIYAGNGKAIHAVNERLDIKVTDVNYTGKVVKVRRIFK